MFTFVIQTFTMDYQELYTLHKEPSLFGRYITLKNIEPLLKNLQTQTIGHSVLNKPIYKYQTGKGKLKILMWSQMHGNESTTTKAVFDFLNVLQSNSDFAKELLSHFTFCILPMLNPDGAELYTRENANKIDLNRDFQKLSQPESQLLQHVFNTFQPNYCFNLHDQRTIFAAGNSGKPATISFLAPSFNENRDNNEVRIKAMNVIVAMNKTLQQFIPNQVGRFDDLFNINCVGDSFQSLNVPTILFEAGHFSQDYDREITRKYIFFALISGLLFFYENEVVSNKTDDYLQIPQNKVVFYDFVYKNVKIYYDNNKIITNFAAHYKEVLSNNQIDFEAYIVQVGDLENYLGHYEFDAQLGQFQDKKDSIPKINEKADFCIGKLNIFVNGVLKVK